MLHLIDRGSGGRDRGTDQSIVRRVGAALSGGGAATALVRGAFGQHAGGRAVGIARSGALARVLGVALAPCGALPRWHEPGGRVRFHAYAVEILDDGRDRLGRAVLRIRACRGVVWDLLGRHRSYMVTLLPPGFGEVPL
jgi:hypothetical protein